MNVIIYTTPFCGPCSATKRYLTYLGIEYTAIDISENDELRKDIFEKAHAVTVPIMTSQQDTDQNTPTNTLDLSLLFRSRGAVVQRLMECSPGFKGYTQVKQDCTEQIAKIDSLILELTKTNTHMEGNEE